MLKARKFIKYQWTQETGLALLPRNKSLKEIINVSELMELMDICKTPQGGFFSDGGVMETWAQYLFGFREC